MASTTLRVETYPNIHPLAEHLMIGGMSPSIITLAIKPEVKRVNDCEPHRTCFNKIMKIKSPVIYWSAFFIVSLLSLALIANFYTEPREIVVNQAQAVEIGQRIAANEGTLGTASLVEWREHEEYSSLGIGHFIWYPQGIKADSISFNDFLLHISASQGLPDWLAEEVSPPWQSQEDYSSKKHDAFKQRMRNFLEENRGEQVQYLIAALEMTFPKLLKEVKNPFSRMHVYENFYHVAEQEGGTYALLDYALFMGDGGASNKRYNDQGWGLLQVLENMSVSEGELMVEFVASADRLLIRRVANAPGNEEKLLTSWRKRLQSYGKSD